MIQRLQLKFILISMFSVLLVLTVIMGTINILNYRKVVAEADSTLQLLSSNNGHFPKIPRYNMNPEKPPEPREPKPRHLSPEAPYETRYFFVLLREDGTISRAFTDKIAAIDEETALEYADQIQRSGKTSGFLNQYRFLADRSRENVLILFLDCQRSLDTFRSFLVISILVSLLGLCSVLFLVCFFSRLVMKPVSESYEKQRQFITDAGHEIKTPITIINANLEILELEYGESEWSQSILKQTTRLADLTNSLIYLSRMEEPNNQLLKIDFSISDLAEETVSSFQAPASAQKKSFFAHIAPLLSYCGDEASIRRLFSVLLDNAIKYSSPQSVIEVTLEKQGKHICFMVANETEELSPETIPRLFDRFYRADASRNSETGGYGIGLSIARAIADAHKGKIFAESKDGSSLLVTVILPL